MKTLCIFSVILSLTVAADFIFRDLNPDTAYSYPFVTYPDNWISPNYIDTTLPEGQCAADTATPESLLGLFGEGKSIDFVYWRLPAHTVIDFRVKVWYADSWTGGSVQFLISNKTQKTALFSAAVTAGTSSTKTCGNTAKGDGGSVIYGSASHTGSYISIRMTSNVVGTTALWGIREFTIAARNATDTPGNFICNTQSSALSITGTCQCGDGFYRTSSGTCAACHATCSSCYGPAATQCFICKKGAAGYEDCLCPDPYVFISGRCFLSCPQGKFKYEGVCVDSCPSYTQASAGACNRKCTSSGVPYWSVMGICTNQCDQNTYDYKQDCFYTCPDNTVQNDAKCLLACPSGKVRSGNKCLTGCPSGFKFADDCGDTCPAGLAANTATPQTCSPCKPPKFIYQNQCIDSCPAGTNPDTITYTCAPEPTCAPKFSYEGQCVTTCPTGTTQNTNSYTCQDFIFRDLYSSPFVNYPNNWDTPPYLDPATNTCGSDDILGGPMQLSTARDYVDFVYTDLPVHSAIQFRVKIYYLDAWDGQAVLFDIVSSTKTTTLSPGTVTAVGDGEDICGSYTSDGFAIVYGKVDHTGSYLLIRIRSTLYNPNTMDWSVSWGIRDFSLSTSATPISAAGSICKITNPSSLGTTDTCQCGDGFYRTSSGTCAACHAACSSCFGPSKTQCFVCDSAYSGYEECMCPAPLKLSQDGKCIVSCATGKKEYQGQCIDTCPATTVASNGQCVSSCTSSQVSYQGQCLDKCPYPKKGYKGGCVDSCPSGTYEDESRNICRVGCSSEMFKAANGKCVTSCGSSKVGYLDQCLDTCPTGFFSYGGKCVMYCPSSKVRVQDYCTTSSCPTGMTAIPDSKFPNIQICQNSDGTLTPPAGACAPPKFTYQGQCLTSCPSGTNTDMNAYACLDDYIFRDLHLDPFINYPESWSSLQFSTLPTTICGTESLMGGYNKFAQGASLDFLHVSLPIFHNSLDFRFKVWFIDAWNENFLRFEFYSATEYLEITKTILFPGKMTAVNGGANACGSSTASDGSAILYGSIPHFGAYLNLRIVSNIESSTASWGIREFSVATRTVTTPQSSMCNIASPTSLAAQGACKCGDGFYQTSSGTCAACHEACAACYGPSKTQCFVCNSAYSGYDECMCPSPLKITQDGKCALPCEEGQFAHQGECVSSCPMPYIESGSNCVNPCPSDQVANYNYPVSTTCETACPAPKVEYLRECLDYCPKYLYESEGKCIATCPSSKVKYGFPYDGECKATCPTPRFKYGDYCLVSCPPGTTADTTAFTCTSTACDPPKFSHGGQCLDSCPAGTYENYNTFTCPACSAPKFLHQGKCLDSCPIGTIPKKDTNPYTCIPNPTGDCLPNCAACEDNKCKLCNTGFEKFDDITCYPVCGTGQKLTNDGVCEVPAYSYQPPSCIDKLRLGVDDISCRIVNGKQTTYEITYEPTTHYFSQQQNGIMMTCSDNVLTRKLSVGGSFLSSIVMIAKNAGLSTLNGVSLTSAQNIGTTLSPLVTDRCDFVPGLPAKLTGFPFYLLGVFPLTSQGADFSALTTDKLSQIYNKDLVDRAIGNLAACGQSCSAILVWKHTNANKPISSHATMLVKLTTTASTGTIDQIFKNAKVTFVDPAATSSEKIEKSTLCYDENSLRYCASELIIYKKKST